jgi:N-sulfoglucosamine sulfohydrolase
MIRRHRLFKGILLLGYLLVAKACIGDKMPGDREAATGLPNIVLIVSDDHGMGDLGCYGNPAVKTPNLDNLASEGIRFNQAYCTSASCSASRSVILTGLYNHANGQFGHAHHFHHFSTYDHVYSLPVLLEELAGYHTGRIGKYHVAPEKVYRFQEVMEADSRNPVAMADSCLDFINSNREHPFFLYFCTSDPHRSGPASDDALAPDLFGNVEGGHEGVIEIGFNSEEVIVPPYLPDSRSCREELAQYYQSVARVDQGVGRLFRHLKEAGLWNRTLIIYISDNGIAFPGAKTTLYQPGIRLPCLVKNPGGENGGVVTDALINWADLTPTILEEAGVLPEAEERLRTRYKQLSSSWESTANESFQGHSFKGVLESGNSTGWNETYASHTFHEITMYYPMKSVITKKYKLIWNIAWQLPYPSSTDLWASSTWQLALQSGSGMYAGRTIDAYMHRPEFELYDLESDPFETRNLAENPAYRKELELLKKKIQTFQERTNDPWILKWEYQ